MIDFLNKVISVLTRCFVILLLLGLIVGFAYFLYLIVSLP